jgi:hypothetical protein
MQPTYGRIGEQEVGGLEVIGYDPATDQFRTYFFDHTGNVITETLTVEKEAGTASIGSPTLRKEGVRAQRYVIPCFAGFTTARIDPSVCRLHGRRV